MTPSPAPEEQYRPERSAFRLPALSALTHSQVRHLALKSSKAAILAALGSGRWVSISDASASRGKAAIAWAVYSPDGALAASEAKIISETNTTEAEAKAALAAARALHRLGAQSALMLMDCKPAIARLADSEKSPRPDGVGQSWRRASQGRFEPLWMPREAMGPANDAARAALDLLPERTAVRGFDTFMAAIGHPDYAKRAPKPRRTESRAWRLREARQSGAWTAIASATPCLDSPDAGAFAAIFDPDGKLRAQIALRWSDLYKNGKNFAYKSAALAVADQLGSLGADKACLAIDSCLVADIFQLTDFHAALTARFAAARQAFGHSAPEPESFSVAFDPRAQFSFASKAAKRLANKSYDLESLGAHQAGLDQALLRFSETQLLPPPKKHTKKAEFQTRLERSITHARHESPKPILFDSNKPLPEDSAFDVAMKAIPAISHNEPSEHGSRFKKRTL